MFTRSFGIVLIVSTIGLGGSEAADNVSNRLNIFGPYWSFPELNDHQFEAPTFPQPTPLFSNDAVDNLTSGRRLRESEIGLTGMIRLGLLADRTRIINEIKQATTSEERRRLRKVFLENAKELDRIAPAGSHSEMPFGGEGQKAGGKACRSACAIVTFGNSLDCGSACKIDPLVGVIGAQK